MTIRKRRTPDGEVRLFIEIRYRTADGRNLRFRRDAQVQSKSGAHAEERRLIAELERTGTLKSVTEEKQAQEVRRIYTFADAVRHFRKTRMTALKPSTSITYDDRLNRELIPRFGDMPLDEMGLGPTAALDAELVRQRQSESSRRNVQIVLRSVVRTAVDAGMLDAMPRFPKLPKVGRKAVNPLHRDDLERILAATRPRVRLACELVAFAGLRAGEVRGLRWSDIDMKGQTITVRRAITRKKEASPKSGDHRVIPIAASLRALLETAMLTRKSPWSEVALSSRGEPWGESGLNEAFQRAQKRVGLKGWTFHDLKHFFVTELFRLGVPAPTVRILAAHADLETTQRYADMGASDLRAAVALFEGNGWATANRGVKKKRGKAS